MPESKMPLREKGKTRSSKRAFPLYPTRPGQWFGDPTNKQKLVQIKDARERTEIERDVVNSKIEMPLLRKDLPKEIRDGLTSDNTCGQCFFRYCCRYVGIPVEDPSSKEDWETFLWLVAHNGVGLYFYNANWTVRFETVCDALQPNGDCGVYENRPQVCREHSNQTCEFTMDYVGQLSEGSELEFHTWDELMAYLRRRFPLWDDPEWDCNAVFKTAEDEEDEEDGVLLTFSSVKRMRKAADVLVKMEPVPDHDIGRWDDADIYLPDITEDSDECHRILARLSEENLSPSRVR